MKSTNQALLSIVVPVYKVEEYLDRCVESIVNQTYTNLEIILVDDGSPDCCPQMCDEWAQKDSRVRVIHKQNGGLSDARNAGIAAASGKYIAFVDSDDYIDWSMYEIMIEAMQRTNSQIACCGRKIVKNNTFTTRHNMERESIFSNAEAIKEMLLGGFIEESVWDKVYETRLFQNVYFPIGEINEDIVIVPLLLNRCQRIVHVGRSLYYYWQNGQSITRSSYSSVKRIVLKHLDAIEEYLKETHAELLPFFSVLERRYCQSVLYLLLDNKEVLKKYRADYQEFYRRFRKSFKPSLEIQNVEKKELIKGYLIYWKIYFHLHLLKISKERLMSKRKEQSHD